MYRIEKNGPFSNSLNFLKILHQIPLSTEGPYLKKFLTHFLVIKMFGFFFLSVGPPIFILAATLSHSGVDITEAISMTLGGSGAGVVCLMFTLRYKKWSKFFVDLADVTTFGKPRTYQETINFLNRLGNICFVGSTCVTIFYGISDWYSTKDCRQTVENFIRICPTFVPIWLPFGGNSMVSGAIIFSLQVFFIGVFIATPFLVECYIMYESTEMLICHISHLNDKFKETFKASSHVEMRNRLRVCVNYHVHIISLGYRLGSLIKYTGGHMSLLSALVCGCIANQMLTTKPLGSLVFMAAWLFALFAFCHAGQRIKDTTLSIGDALYSSKWYKADKVTRRDVQFILMRCQKPICFEAIPLGVTDYPYYYMMIKTGYSYFTLLNQSV